MDPSFCHAALALSERDGIAPFDDVMPSVLFVVSLDGDVAVDGELGLVEGYCCANAEPAMATAPVSPSTSSIGLR